MGLKVGTADAARVYVGNAPARSVFRGTSKAWPTAPILDATNLAVNPGLESGSLSGWNSNDGTRYPIALDTSSAMSGINSCRGTRADPNMLTAGANGTFEGGDISNWSITGTGATIAASTAQKHGGTYSLLGTWGASASGNALRVVISGLVSGQTYCLSGWAYVPTGSVDVRLQVQGIAGQGPDITQRDQWVYSEFSFVATATSHNGQFSSPSGGQAAGTMVYVDDIQVTHPATAVVAASIYTQSVGSSGTTAFPCVPGQPITASIDVKCEQPNRRLQIYYGWLDAAGAGLGTSNVIYPVADTGAANTVWRIQNTSAPPANAVQCRVTVQVLTLSTTTVAIAGERVWFDNLRVSTGPAIADAVNLHPNPGAGEPTSAGSLLYIGSCNASILTISLDALSAMSGRYSASEVRLAATPNTQAGCYNLTGTGPGSTMPCTPGVDVTGSADVKTNQANRNGFVYFQWFDGAGALLSTGASSPNVALTPNVVARVSTTSTPPANAVGCRFVVNIRPVSGNAVTGELSWCDNVRVSVGTETTYFGGDSPPDGTYIYTWTGGHSSSASQRWRVSGTQQRDSTYFDGDTPSQAPYTYRWTGAARASTSERVLAPLSAAAINLALDPISDTSTSVGTFWTGTRGTLTNPTGYKRLTITDALATFGAQRINTSATAGIRPVCAPGDTIRVVSQARSSALFPMAALIQFFDASSVQIGSNITGTSVTTNASTFVDVPEVSAVAPANTAWFSVWIFLAGTGARAINDTFDVRHVGVFKSTSPVPYFAGDTPAAPPYTYDWAGTAHASQSRKWI